MSLWEFFSDLLSLAQYRFKIKKLCQKHLLGLSGTTCNHVAILEAKICLNLENKNDCQYTPAQ